MNDLASMSARLRKTAVEDVLCGAGDREVPSLKLASQLFPLRSVPDSTDNHVPVTHAIENNVRSAADDQFADSRLSSGAAQARMVSESFNHSDDSCGQSLGCIRLVQRNISANLLKPRQR